MDGLMPIVVALITAIAGVFAYFFQRIVDRKNQLINLRRQEYTKFIDAFQAAIEEQTPESLINYHKALGTLFVVASDPVIRAAGNLNHYMAETSSPCTERKAKKVGDLMAAMFRMMRQDCFEKTELVDREIRNLLPFREMTEQG